MKLDENETPWYSQYPTLHRALVLLKPLPDYVQELVGKQLYTYAKELSFEDYEALPTNEDSSTAGLKKIRQFMQNKKHHSLVSRALNEVMALNEEGRNLVGKRLLLCLQALDNLARQHGSEDFTATHQSRVEVHTLVKLVFTEEMSRFEQQGKQQQEERKIVLEEEAKAEELLAKAAKQVNAMSFDVESDYPEISDPILSGLDLDPELAKLASLLEEVPAKFEPILDRLGRLLILKLAVPDNESEISSTAQSEEQVFQDTVQQNEIDVINNQNAEEEVLKTSEPLEPLDILEVSFIPEDSGEIDTKTVSETGEANSTDTLEKAPLIDENTGDETMQTLHTPTPEEGNTSNPYELSQADMDALVQEVIDTPSKNSNSVENKILESIGLIQNGVDIDALPEQESIEEKLALGLAMFNQEELPFIKPNKRKLALTEEEIDALIAETVKKPEVQEAKRKAKEKVLAALAFLEEMGPLLIPFEQRENTPVEEVKETKQMATPVKRQPKAKDAFKTKDSSEKVAKTKTSPKSKPTTEASQKVSKKKVTKTEESLPNLKALNKAVSQTPQKKKTQSKAPKKQVKSD
jgi:hypothetical protein